jgi:subtilisin family serine protease
VGAVWDAPGGAITFLGCSETSRAADQPTCFTNSNATVDLYAPGAFLVASGRNGGTSTFGGTSQATPLTAGCAAAIRGASPSLTPAQVKAMLIASPTQVIDAKNGLSFPRLDCAHAAGMIALFANGFEG